MTSRRRKKGGSFAVAVVMTLVLGACTGDDAGASRGTTRLANPTQTLAAPGGAETGPVSSSGGAAAGSRAKTRVTIHDKPLYMNRARLWGIVESERPWRCAMGREIVVFSQRGSEQDPKTDLDVMYDNSSFNRWSGPRYKWSVILGGGAGRSPYYARVKRTVSCRADTSRSVDVQFGGF